MRELLATTGAAAAVDPALGDWLGFTPQQWTLAGLLGMCVLMILTGFLKPKPDVLRELNDVKADRDAWKELAQKSQETARMLAEAARENTEPTKTVAKFITAAQQASGVTPDGGLAQ